MQYQTDTDQPRPVAEAKRLGGGCLDRLVRAFRWCFVRRIAVKPYMGDKDSNPEDWPSRMMWEWQKMPHNWRWRYNERFQAGLRKAADELNKP